jgi:4-amino-4-deoxy-L-arabinose transferase-like glycosyltransferase
MVAWVIRLFAPFGDNELAIRLGTLLLHPLSALLVFATGRSMFNQATGLRAALLFISLPLVGFNSLFMTTDAPLFFFWGLAAWALWQALHGNAWRHWLLAGAAAGLGMLSKYSMLVFLLSTSLVLCLPAYRGQWRNRRLHCALLLALLIFLPNVWWNAHAGFVSFRHTAEITQLDRGLFHPVRLAEFIGAQAACMGPLAFVLLLAGLCSPLTWRDPRLGFLAALTLPFLAVIALQALLARANPNWAAPAYFGGALLVAARLPNSRGWLMPLAIGTNLLVLSAFYHYHDLAAVAGIEMTRKRDPYARLQGWPQAGAALRALLARHPGATLAVTARDEFALLAYYTRPPDGRVRIWNPQRYRANHFHLVADAGRDVGADFLFATRQQLGDAPAAAFERWTALGCIRVALYPHDDLTLYLYRGQGFKGYRP